MACGNPACKYQSMDYLGFPDSWVTDIGRQMLFLIFSEIECCLKIGLYAFQKGVNSKAEYEKGWPNVGTQ